MIAVAAGQRYRVPRRGLPARHIRVTRVSKGPRVRLRDSSPREHGQPVAFYVETTRSGRRKKGALSVRSFLQFRSGAWRMGPAFEEIP